MAKTLAFLFLLLSFACKKKEEDPSPVDPGQSDNRLYGFDTNPNYGFVKIDTLTDTVYVLFPPNDSLFDSANVQAIPYFHAQSTCSIAPNSKLDLTKLTNFTITSADKKNRTYTIKPMPIYFRANILAKYDTLMGPDGTAYYNVTKRFDYLAGRQRTVGIYNGQTPSFYFGSVTYNLTNLETQKKDTLMKALAFNFTLTFKADRSDIIREYIPEDGKVSFVASFNGSITNLPGKLNITKYNSFLQCITGTFEMEGGNLLSGKADPDFLSITNGRFENIPIASSYQIH